MCHELQSSLEMEFLRLEYSGIEEGFQRLLGQRPAQKIFKNSDSDSPNDGESKSTVRISIAQSSAKLGVLQRIRYFKKPFRRVFGIWATVLEQDAVELLSKSEKVLEVTNT